MKFLNLVICDQVRQEVNGKLIIIGVYPYNIELSAFPHRIALSMWMQIAADWKDSRKLDIRIRDEDGVDRVRGEVSIEPPGDDGLYSMIFPPSPIQLIGPTTLLFQFREAGKKWKTLKTMPVQLREQVSSKDR